MTVKELKELLENCNDDLFVFVDSNEPLLACACSVERIRTSDNGYIDLMIESI